MCSISGWISTTPLSPSTAKRLTSALLFFGSERGRQSTGVWSNGTTVKRAMPPEQFINIRAFNALMEQPTRLILGHTRAPTSGGKGDQQAQPFKRGEVVTVHNGMVHNFEELEEKHGLDCSSGVDSELFTAYIAKNGIDKLPDLMPDVRGNAALGIVLNEKELYLLRDGNPTEYIILDLVGGEKLTVFGSTMSIVNDALNHVWLVGRKSTITSTHGALLRLTGDAVTIVAEPRPRKQAYFAPHRGTACEDGTWVPYAERDKSKQQTRLSLKWDAQLGCMVYKDTGKPVKGSWEDGT